MRTPPAACMHTPTHNGNIMRSNVAKAGIGPARGRYVIKRVSPGFDSWGSDPLTIWIDGLAVK